MKRGIQRRWCVGTFALLVGLTVHAALRLYCAQAAGQIAALEGQCIALDRRLKKLQAIQVQGLKTPVPHTSRTHAFSQEMGQLLQEACATLGGHNIVISREESIPGAVPEMHLSYQLNRYRVGLRAPISAVAIAAALPDRLPQLYRVEGVSCRVQEEGYEIVLILSLIEAITTH